MARPARPATKEIKEQAVMDLLSTGMIIEATLSAVIALGLAFVLGYWMGSR
jgi:uncharacterized membrane protein